MLRNDHEPSRAKFAPLTINYAGMGPLGQAWETLPFPRSPPASPSPLSGAALCRGREVAGRRFRPVLRIAPWLPGPIGTKPQGENFGRQTSTSFLFAICGAGCRNRTRDPVITNHVLYHLS